VFDPNRLPAEVQRREPFFDCKLAMKKTTRYLVASKSGQDLVVEAQYAAVSMSVEIHCCFASFASVSVQRMTMTFWRQVLALLALENASAPYRYWVH
jgi:hypothetical protein